MSKPVFFMKGLIRSALLSFLAISHATAQGTPSRETPATSGRGEIHGRVVSSATQAPIGAAGVEVRGGGTADSLTRAATGPDGSFRVPALRAGTYRVRISALGFAPRELARVTVGAAVSTVDVARWR